jgi:hypothetical protein
MKRTLFQSIVKESIDEGGNAVPSAQPSRGDLAGEIAKGVTNEVSSTFNREEEPAYSTSLSERLETLKLNINDVRKIAKSLVNEYRERKSYQKPEDAEFIERMNQFCKKYGYEPFTYSRNQGLDPEAYAKQILKRHNTFLRGLTLSGLEDAESHYPGFREAAIKELQKQGIKNPNIEDLMRYAATTSHPFNELPIIFASTGNYATGYGAPSNNANGFTDSGAAKIVRPYKLGPDRMRWFDVGNGDFDVKDQTKLPSMKPEDIKPGDAFRDFERSSGEVTLGPGAVFDGWLTSDELEYNKTGLKQKKLLDKYKKERTKIYRTDSTPQEKLKDLDKKYDKYRKNRPKDFYDWLTSRK